MRQFPDRKSMVLFFYFCLFVFDLLCFSLRFLLLCRLFLPFLFLILNFPVQQDGQRGSQTDNAGGHRDLGHIPQNNRSHNLASQLEFKSHSQTFGQNKAALIDSYCKDSLTKMKGIPFLMAPECSVSPKVLDEELRVFRKSVEIY